MKNKILQAATAFVLLGLMSFSTASQTYYWDDYSIQITVPDDFKVTKDNGEEFHMKGDGMEMYMHIWNEKIAAEDLDDETIKEANAMHLQEIDDHFPFDSGDFAGYYVEGFKNGDRVMFAGVMDKKTATNFYIEINFDDTDKEAEKEALKILKSLDHK